MATRRKRLTKKAECCRAACFSQTEAYLSTSHVSEGCLPRGSGFLFCDSPQTTVFIPHSRTSTVSPTGCAEDHVHVKHVLSRGSCLHVCCSVFLHSTMLSDQLVGSHSTSKNNVSVGAVATNSLNIECNKRDRYSRIAGYTHRRRHRLLLFLHIFVLDV